VKIRVLTYNIHKCIGGIDRRYAPDRIRDTVMHYDPDVVLLQEVDHEVPRSNHDKQVDMLGDLLKMRHRTWFPNVRVRGGGSYGNAILSKFLLSDTRNIDVTVPPKKRRSVLHAKYRVRLPGQRGLHTRTVHIFNMHPGLAGYERKLQLRTFLESHPFAHLDHRTPIIVAGDFNDVWGTLGRQLIPSGFVGVERPLRTFPAYAPVRALDSIYVRGTARLTHIQRGQVAVARQASDHLPLIADIEIT
jgi:endonuclease/exonuclease/phosphatase family metal-dependent hydrolase